MPTKSFLIAAAFASLTATGCGSGGSATTADYKHPAVVVAIPKEGPLAHLGRDAERAARMQFEARTKSGFLGALRLVTVDEAEKSAPYIDPEKVAQRTQEQVDSGTVVAWVGGIDSDAVAVELPRLNEAGIIAVSPSATATPFNLRDPAFPGAPIKYFPAFAKFGLTFARTAPTDLTLGRGCLASLAKQRLVRVFTVDAGDTDGDSFSSAVQSQAPLVGGELVGHESVSTSSADWDGLSRQIANSKAQVIIWGSAISGVESEFWASLKQAGVSVPVLFGTAMPPTELARLPSSIPTSSVCSASAPAETLGVQGPRFAQDFKRRWGHAPAAGSLRGAAAMALALKALEQASGEAGTEAGLEASRAATALRLSRISRFDSLLGPMELSPVGNWNQAPIGMWQLSAGRAVFRQVR